VLWVVALEYIGGGIVGGLLGMLLAVRLAPRRAALNQIFAGVVFVVRPIMLYHNVGAIHLS
jgi:hypothetical protein